MDIISVTEKAKEKIREMAHDNSFFKVNVKSGGCAGFTYDFEIVEKIESSDIRIEENILIDFRTSGLIQGSTLDYIENTFGSKFDFINPNATTICGCGKSFCA